VNFLQLTGIGLRFPHDREALSNPPPIAWFEVHSENYFVEGGEQLARLERIRSNYPVSLHGVGLSLGSADELNWQHLKKLKELAARIEPCLVSDHLSWSSVNGHYLHDLLPLPFTQTSLKHLINRIQLVQDYLRTQILIENITSYLAFNESAMVEEEFIQEVAKQAGCGILLDINNIYVSSHHLHFDPYSYITRISPHLVQELHVAGFSTIVINQEEKLIDSHDELVAPPVWDLYQHAIQHLGAKPTIVEWDQKLPSLDTLCSEAMKAEEIMRGNRSRHGPG